MVRSDISEKIKSFIFQYIDSVEQLEVLLFLRKHNDESCSVEEITNELRSNVTSVKGRLENLKSSGLIIGKENSNSYHYDSQNTEIEEIVQALAEEYRVRKHLILELIFSPLKKMKKFADSFVFGSTEKRKGEDDG